ncbi:rRNA maturation RNase YbeY [Clostridium sp. LBM24168]
MIFIDNRQSKIGITDELKNIIVEVIEHTLKEEKVDVPCEISIIFIDNESIRNINRENRGIDKVTDVLSFPMLEYPEGKVFKEVYPGYEFQESDMDGKNLILGDIAISLEKAEEQRKEFGHSFFREICYLTVHSVLHLLGYDHMQEDEKKKMREREEKILKNFQL